MAEEKHRMLYQGQDPAADLPHHPLQSAPLTQPPSPPQRPLSLSPSEPPTYEDAIAPPQVLENFGYSPDRRRTFFAEPQHIRSRMAELAVEETHFSREVLPQLQTIPEQDEEPPALPPRPMPVHPPRLPMPEVRNFFALTPQPKLGDAAADIMCPACGERIITEVRRTPNARTNALAGWLCTFGWCCCACVCPYFLNFCRTTSHYCPTCKVFLGSHYPQDRCRQ
ncbi:cell death-inducing p53-target protein 1 [Drosophila ananassae]|nr:cell death-inducing p53-target protein 1 [Drosophila ananassae]